MKTNSTPDPIKLDRLIFDRLVDGALSSEEYRRVLQAMEHQPEAWRWCAEAFLEAQAWRGEFTELRRHTTALPVEVTPAPASHQPSSASSDWLRMSLVAAASFLFAFVAARAYWQQSNQLPAPEERNLVAQNQPAHSPATGNPVPTTYVSHNQPLGKVQLTVNRGEGQEPTYVEMPVYEEAVASQLLSHVEPALPDDLVQALEAEGHQVNLQRSLVAVPLNDGREMMLPVEGYRIVPVSRPSY
jgi:hypothetical protein